MWGEFTCHAGGFPLHMTSDAEFDICFVVTWVSCWTNIRVCDGFRSHGSCDVTEMICLYLSWVDGFLIFNFCCPICHCLQKFHVNTSKTWPESAQCCQHWSGSGAVFGTLYHACRVLNGNMSLGYRSDNLEWIESLEDAPFTCMNASSRLHLCNALAHTGDEYTQASCDHCSCGGEQGGREHGVRGAGVGGIVTKMGGGGGQMSWGRGKKIWILGGGTRKNSEKRGRGREEKLEIEPG